MAASARLAEVLGVARGSLGEGGRGLEDALDGLGLLEPGDGLLVLGSGTHCFLAFVGHDRRLVGVEDDALLLALVKVPQVPLQNWHEALRVLSQLVMQVDHSVANGILLHSIYSGC